MQARKDGQSHFADPGGTVSLSDPHYSAPELNWPDTVWYDYTIQLANGKTFGAAVMNHPDNPSTTWHNSSRLWMLHPVITAGGAITIKKGTTLTLRYRVVAHDGDTPREALQKLSAEWRRM